VDQVLVTVTGYDVSPAVYAAVVAVLALSALSGRPETASSELV
jgi:hypothetical protein